MTKTKPRNQACESKVRPERAAAVIEKPVSMAVSPLAAKPKESAKEREARERRREALQQMLMQKRQEILKEIEGSLGQSLTEDQQRRLESARDVGDQALMDLDRELGISLMEMRNRRRQAIDEALTRLNEGHLRDLCGVRRRDQRATFGSRAVCKALRRVSGQRRASGKNRERRRSRLGPPCPSQLRPALSVNPTAARPLPVDTVATRHHIHGPSRNFQHELSSLRAGDLDSTVTAALARAAGL